MTVDELKARRKELSAKKKALELDGSDAIALCMVKEGVNPGPTYRLQGRACAGWPRYGPPTVYGLGAGGSE